VEEYLLQQLKKHSLLSFIEDVAKIGFPREADKMITCFVVPRSTLILKYVPKDPASIEWMQFANEAHQPRGKTAPEQRRRYDPRT
jgi:hypothetical protein